ncbi:peptidoglycan-binding protein [Sphingomonas sp. HF-S4]|uniref:Peptidoglycan-binding protein n=1 Tax=Sphingomonas agrestis TaxID=3080540 RepID=A0ABU3Y9I8_9SPHN|nr:peptidoglycan-binding protein [Sphingomonas sp. HF-S4]MDV3457922.1 peptidoglycan-binding protein [Sphingomonas sp. HF-S4]
MSDLTQLVSIPAGINPQVSSAKQATMLALLGNPRSSYDASCREVTNAPLAAMMVTRTIAPIRVRGLKPALDSLETIFADIKAQQPRVHAALGTAGMLCARLVRGSATAISNHSWGTAIDLTIDGDLDTRGDGRVQLGLTLIAPIFNRHGWFWGAGFRTEDGMHFEAGDALIREWHAKGLFSGAPAVAPPPALSLGDRGPEVVALQEQLSLLGASLQPDGEFGPATRAAVMAFQAGHGCAVDGIVGPKTASRMSEAIETRQAA